MVRKILSILIVISFTCQIIAHNKLNNQSRLLLHKYKADKNKSNSLIKSINGIDKIDAFIIVSDNSIIDKLKDLGIDIYLNFDNNIYTATLPLANINQILDIPEISKIEFANELTDRKSVV